MMIKCVCSSGDLSLSIIDRYYSVGPLLPLSLLLLMLLVSLVYSVVSLCQSVSPTVRLQALPPRVLLPSQRSSP